MRRGVGSARTWLGKVRACAVGTRRRAGVSRDAEHVFIARQARIQGRGPLVAVGRPRTFLCVFAVLAAASGSFAAGSISAAAGRIGASPGKGGYVENYCAKTNPSYPIEVYWGKPPAWYCTDDLASPSKSIPFSPAAACASDGLGPPDASKFGVASYVICGRAAPPTTPMYTVSGTVSYQGCPSVAGCSLRPPAVTISIWTGTLVAKTTVSGAGNFKLRVKKGLYTIQADPKAYS